MLQPEKILEGLTEPQRDAATTIDGPLLVLAGAGSGKTRTITRRIAYMVACGIPRESIVALTFTNKAAGEMRHRVEQLLGHQGQGWSRSQGVTVATFHSLCARLAREFAQPLGLPPTFGIFDSGDQGRLVKAALKELQLSPERFQPQAVLSTISKAKNQLLTAQQFTEKANGFFDQQAARVYARYEAMLRENKAVDFDDLLMKMALLLRDNTNIRRQLQERYQYILIDEYQDTNQAQFLLAHMLAMHHKNICATGDPDQSIYGWRGANLQNILTFESHYPNAKVVLLEQNYRSTKTILQAASALIANNQQRKKKDLWTENETGPRIVVLETLDEHHEAREVVQRLKNAHTQEKLAWEHMAIFYRVNSLSRVLEDSLMKAAIPYQIARGTEFYGRKEVKDVLAYLKVIANPADTLSLQRIINVPPRGLGETAVTRLENFAAEMDVSLLDACRAARDAEGLAPRAVISAQRVAEMFARFRTLAYGSAAQPTPPATSPAEPAEVEQDYAAALAEAEEIPAEHVPQAAAPPESPPPGAGYIMLGGVRGLVEIVVRESGLEEALKKQDAEGEEISNIGELINVAAEFDAQNPGASLEDFLQQTSLASDVDRIKDGGGSVTLMTLHAAKGLEFPLVAMVGWEDGLLPHGRALGFAASTDELEEERRLAFVGVTRAMRQLIISHAASRMVRGTTQRSVPSQFLDELPKECLDVVALRDPLEAPGSGSYRDEAGYLRRAQQESQRVAEARQQKQQAQAVASQFSPGRLVRHPQFGIGRIEDISAAGSQTRAVVQFQSSGRKTLILQYARLEPVDA